MVQSLFTKEKTSKMMIVFLPILITQLGLFAISFFDTFMSGKFSPIDLAGVAIGTSLWVPIYNGCSGILLAVTPIVAQLFGQRSKPAHINRAVMQAIYLSLIMSILLILLGALFLRPMLGLMNLEQEVGRIAFQYLAALSFGIVPLFVYNVLRCFIDALGKTSVSMFITIVTLPVNVVANYAFIYGKFGLPAFGGVGAGIASSITYWVIMLIAIVITTRVHPFSEYGLLRSLPKPSLSEWGNTMKIGLPIGMAIFFETSIFAAVTLFMSSYNTITIASHQAAINFSSFLYMVPLSFSMALTILVGQEAGANQLKRAREFSLMGILFAVGFSCISAIILLVFRDQVAYLYTNDPEVAILTAKFLIFAIFFQLSDALQAPIQGALRGYKDVNVTFFMTLLSYWVIGLPAGYALANYTALGAFGYWIGLITGLAIGAAGLSARLIIVQRRIRKTA
ncbi:MATE family efflux transporter [Pradoshia sp.]|uniref:MATE family efflux transporter n=1 Tax=Pradoshia sp. TaxID=2651281 RepID=UPI003F11CA86